MYSLSLQEAAFLLEMVAVLTIHSIKILMQNIFQIEKANFGLSIYVAPNCC